MATFKVGQRVRIIKGAAIVAPNCLDVPGSEGVLLRPYLGWSEPEWIVDVIGHGYPEVVVPEAYLAPLTDPAADAFLESIKKLKPYEEPKVDANGLPQYDQIGAAR